ncbi:hypothetical protein ACU4GD_12185 [Cupriavidus basilensis]
MNLRAFLSTLLAATAALAIGAAPALAADKTIKVERARRRG